MSGNKIQQLKREASTAKNINSLMLKKILNNVEFNLIVKSGNKDDVGSVINGLFKEPIETDPNHTSLGGEMVLTVQHPSKIHDTSIHLMHFSGKQDKHVHPGPRVVTVIAKEPWTFYVGNQFDTLPESDKLNMVKIVFPGNSLTTIAMSKKTLHGFQGESMGAISVHYTDKEEANELGLSPDKLQDKEVMNLLTKTPDQSRINVVASVNFEDIKNNIEQDRTRSML